MEDISKLTITLIIGCIVGIAIATIMFVGNANMEAELINMQITQFQEKIDSQEIEINELEQEIQLLENTEPQNGQIQETFNQLFTDAANCYWADLCAKSQQDCENHFSNVDLSAYEIKEYYSNECSNMQDNWDAYLANDTTMSEN